MSVFAIVLIVIVAFFAGMEGTTLEPDAADVEGYRAFLAAFRKANEAEKAAEAAFAE